MDKIKISAAINACKQFVNTVKEFESMMKKIEDMNNYKSYIESINLLTIEDYATVVKLVDKYSIKSSLSAKTINEAVTFFSKGKVISLKEILPKFASMHDKGIKASECGNKLARYYKEMNSIGLIIVAPNKESISRTLCFSKLGFYPKEMNKMKQKTKSKKELIKHIELLSKELIRATDNCIKASNERDGFKIQLQEIKHTFK